MGDGYNGLLGNTMADGRVDWDMATISTNRTGRLGKRKTEYITREFDAEMEPIDVRPAGLLLTVTRNPHKAVAHLSGFYFVCFIFVAQRRLPFHYDIDRWK